MRSITFKVVVVWSKQPVAQFEVISEPVAEMELVHESVAVE